jgi:hypothetical protein
MNMNQYWRETVCFICGVFIGSGAMLWLMVEVYEGKPKPQPVVVERSVPGETANLEAQIKTLNAKIDANYTQQMTRQKEVRLKTEKLELAKQVHDTQLVTAQDGADDIRKMAAELGVSRMVVK